MKKGFYFFLICFLPLNLLFSQMILVDIPELSEIGVYEVTGQINYFSFKLADSKLKQRLGASLKSTNDFGGVPGQENYDIYLSDSVGNFSLNGSYITIECWYEGTSGGGGCNIAQVELKFNNGISIPSSKLVSYFSSGNNYLSNSQLLAVDCKPDTWSTLGNVSQNDAKYLRLTFSFSNLIKVSNFQICKGEKFEYKVGNQIFNENNLKGVVLQTSQNGCDKAEIVTIALKPQIIQEINYTKCENEDFSVTINGKTFNKNNPKGEVTVKSKLGCDSLFIVNINFISLLQKEISYKGCKGDQFYIEKNGIIFNETNPIGSVLVSSLNYCDTIFNISMNFDTLPHKSIKYKGCKGDGKMFTLNKINFNELNPRGIITVPSALACDTIYTIDLVYEDIPEKKLLISRCKGDGFSVLEEGVFYNENNLTGQYKISASEGCDTLVNLSLEFKECDQCKFFAPNIILLTSSVNNIFTIYLDAECVFEDLELLIYDRWGNNVYKGNQLTWDGTFKNIMCESGVYGYIIKYQIYENSYVKNGTITVLK